jgi:hypothetical protein
MEIKHETTKEEASYYSLKSELEGGFAKMINSFRDRKGLYPIKLTNEILKNLSPIPAFKNNPQLYLKWAEEKNTKLKQEQEEENKTIVSKNNGRIKYLLETEKPEYKSLGCGIHTDPNTNEEFMYFGTKVYEGNFGDDAIITSDNKVLVAFKEENQIRQVGINYRFPFFESVLDYSWSNNKTEYSINKFIFGEQKKVDLKECYEDTLNNEINFMDYQEDMMYVSKSCDIESSYYLPVFETKGRTFDNAEKGSGKTKGAMLYDLQMFNPIMSADMSGASYFRIIESTSASIIIDDFDAVEEEKKQSQIQVMRTGYKKGQKAVRVSEGKIKIPEAFNIFNSMIINNVGGLDEITQDRCNTYQLIKSTNTEKINRRINDKEPKWLIQRDKKYYCALQNWKLVRDTYDNLKVEGINGRDLERVAPILTIGKIVLDEDTFNQLLEYEKKKIEEHKDRDVSSDWLFMALKKSVEILIDASQSDKETGVWVRLDELVSKIMTDNYDPSNRDYDKTKKYISIYLGKIFKNTPLFQSGKVHGGFVRYLFEPTKLIKFLEIRDYLNYFNESELIRALPLSIQSNQSHPTILSIQSIHNQPIPNSKNNDNFPLSDSMDSMDRTETGQEVDTIKEIKGGSNETTN